MAVYFGDIILLIMFFSISAEPFSKSSSSFSYLLALLLSQPFHMPTTSSVIGIVKAQ